VIHVVALLRIPLLVRGVDEVVERLTLVADLCGDPFEPEDSRQPACWSSSPGTSR